MGCGCKSENKGSKSIQPLEEKTVSQQHWGIKILLFIFTLVLLPLILIMFIWLIYNSVINGKSVNDSLAFLFKKMENLKSVKENEYNEDEDDDLGEIDVENYEYELIGLDKN